MKIKLNNAPVSIYHLYYRIINLTMNKAAVAEIDYWSACNVNPDISVEMGGGNIFYVTIADSNNAHIIEVTYPSKYPEVLTGFFCRECTAHDRVSLKIPLEVTAKYINSNKTITNVIEHLASTVQDYVRLKNVCTIARFDLVTQQKLNFETGVNSASASANPASANPASANANTGVAIIGPSSDGLAVDPSNAESMYEILQDNYKFINENSRIDFDDYTLIKNNCCICFHTITDRFVLDACGHTCVCSGCIPKMKSVCPICYRTFTKFYKIYL